MGQLTSPPGPEQQPVYRSAYEESSATASQVWTQRRRRDRHGRQQMSTRISPHLPGWKTRREEFESALIWVVRMMTERVPEIDSIEFAFQEVPPSDPAPWEDHSTVLSRVFPRDKARNLQDRIVVYRRPVLMRCRPHELVPFLQLIVAERVSQVLAIDPEDLLN